jgi:hypothetical protein
MIMALHVACCKDDSRLSGLADFNVYVYVYWLSIFVWNTEMEKSDVTTRFFNCATHYSLEEQRTDNAVLIKAKE